MPALDDVTQTFIANVAPYIAGLDEAIKKAAEFAAANKAAASSMGGMSEMEAAASISAEVLIDVLAELRDVNASLMMQTQLLASADDHLAMVQRDVTASSVELEIILGTLRAQYRELAGDALMAAGAMTAAGAAGRASAAGATAGGGGGRMGLGILGNFMSIGQAIHWLVMGSLEILATALPAILTFGAAIAAMGPTFVQFSDHMNQLRVATGTFSSGLMATNGPLAKLGANIQLMQKNVQPDAFIILGSAISIATSKTGAFNSITQQASNILATFSTKIVADLQGQAGQQIQGFFKNAITDFVQWGQVLGNFGHVFINIMSAMPGVSQALLAVLDAISHALVVITSNPIAEWLIGLIAAMSAVYRYGQLMAAIFGAIWGSGVIGGIRTFASEIMIATEKLGVMNGITTVLKGNLLALSLNPVFWAAIAAAAVAFGIWYFATHRATDAVDALIAHMNKMPMTFANLSTNIVTLGNTLDNTQRKLYGYQQAMANVSRTTYDSTNQAKSQKAAREALGISMAQEQGDVAKLTQEMLKEAQAIQSLTQSLRSMGMSNSQAAAAMNVLGIQTGLQDSKVQQLNQAWDQYLQLMLGGMSGVANMTTALSNMTSVTATSGIKNLSQSTQQLTLNAQQFAAALAQGPAGTTGASAWQNFAQIMQSNIEPLMNWMQTARTAGAISIPSFSRGIADLVMQMVPFTGTVGPAADILQALLNRAGVTGLTLQNLAQYTGGAGKAAKDFTGIITATTVAMTNASQIAQNLSSAMQTAMTQAFSAAALGATTFNQDVRGLASAIRTYGAGSSQAAAAAAQVNQDMQEAQGIARGMTTQVNNAAGAVNNFAQAVKNVPGYHKVIIDIHGVATGIQVPGGVSQNNINRILGGGRHGLVMGLQGGGMIGGMSGIDSNLFALTAGEAVLNPMAVSALGGPLGVHALNNKPSEAVLTTGGRGGTGQMSIQNHIVVELDGKQLTSAWRTSQLTYDRRNPGPSVALNRPGRPG